MRQARRGHGLRVYFNGGFKFLMLAKLKLLRNAVLTRLIYHHSDMLVCRHQSEIVPSGELYQCTAPAGCFSFEWRKIG